MMSIIAESHYPCAIIDDIIVETSIATMESELPAQVFPSFKSVSCLSCAWGALSGHEFSMGIDRAYSETIRDLIFSRFHQELVESVLSANLLAFLMPLQQNQLLRLYDLTSIGSPKASCQVQNP